MHVLYIHPPGTGPNSMLSLKPPVIDESKVKKQFQILYQDQTSSLSSSSQAQIRLVMESERANEMIKLIQDYMKDPDDVGWEPPARKPKTLMQLL